MFYVGTLMFIILIAAIAFLLVDTIGVSDTLKITACSLILIGWISIAIELTTG